MYATGSFDPVAYSDDDQELAVGDDVTPLDCDDCDDGDDSGIFPTTPFNNLTGSSTESSTVNKLQNKKRGLKALLPPKKKSTGEGMVVAMQQFASAYADRSKKEFFHLSSAMTKAKQTEIYVEASCGQKVKVLQWVKNNAEIVHYMDDNDLNEFMSELLSE
jgi:hypothetical protein